MAVSNVSYYHVIIPVLTLWFTTFLLSKENQAVAWENGVFDYDTFRFFPPDWENETTFTQKDYTWKKNIRLSIAGLIFKYYFERFSIDILNARMHDIQYNVTGFKLVDSPVEDMDWTVKENREKFYDGMMPYIEDMFPEAELIEFRDDVFMVRSTTGDNVLSIDVPHLDYHHNQTAPHEDFVPKKGSIVDPDHYDIVLGIWKPTNMNNPVVDFPFALMDASTLFEEDSVRVLTYVNQKLPGQGYWEKFGRSGTCMSGTVKHSEKQRWFYYPHQTNEEVIIFTHWTKGSLFHNVHSSFEVPGYPKGFEPRRSIETRIGIRLKKQNI